MAKSKITLTHNEKVWQEVKQLEDKIEELKKTLEPVTVTLRS